MVKDIIQSRRENVRRPGHRTSVRSEDGHSLSSLESSDTLHEVNIFQEYYEQMIVLMEFIT